MSLAARLGWQMTAHATGGGSTDILLDAYEAVDREMPLSNRRFTLTHANFFSGEAIRRAAALGVVADMQPYRSLLAAGVIVAGGSDHMLKFDARQAVSPFNPFFGMWTVITRITAAGSVYDPEQRISRESALRMWTLNGACLTLEEDVKGSLEPGKYADFVVIDRDILTFSEDELPAIQVLATVLGRAEVYSAVR